MAYLVYLGKGDCVNLENKTVYTLRIDDFNREIYSLTEPWIRHWCKKIGAEFVEITKRRFPDFGITFEKHQVFELAKQRQDDWSIFLDMDTLIHPDFFNITDFIPRDHCAMNGSDPAFLRWKYTREMTRDFRHLGACTWFVIGSDLTREIFEPPPELTMEQIKNSIFPVHGETITGLIPPERLVEDFTFSQNLAKYSLKFIKVEDILISLNYKDPQFLCHLYNLPSEEKIERLKGIMQQWRLI